MTHGSRAITSFVLLLFTSTAFSQVTGSTTSTGTSTGSATSTGSTTSGTSGTTASPPSVGATIKQEVRSGLAQLLVTIIEGMFQDLRTSLGLPAVAADSTSDPLSVLQSAIVNIVNTVSTQVTSQGD